MNKPYSKLLLQSLFALITCSILVMICYYDVDKPVAFFVYNDNIYTHVIFKSMSYIADILSVLAPIIIITLAIKLAWQPFGLFGKTLFVAMVNLCVTLMIKNYLKFAFGRYWPMTWAHNNPSLIKDNAYGFHFIHKGLQYQSFPSGHTAVIFAVMTVFWIVYPKWRGLYILACATVIIGLIGENYHFVSDVIAGAFLGAITAVYAVKLAQLKKSL